MNREALDEFFATAEDVLDHWEPSDDAMVARVADEDADLPLADSYYAQGSSHSWAAMWSPIMDMYQRMISDTMVFGQSFAEARPEGIVRVPVTRWFAFDEAIDWTPTVVEPSGLAILQEWIDESVTSQRGQELDALYSLVDFERYWSADECLQRPVQPADDVIVPRLAPEVSGSEPWRWGRKHNTGPRDRRGLDGRFRR